MSVQISFPAHECVCVWGGAIALYEDVWSFYQNSAHGSHKSEVLIPKYLLTTRQYLQEIMIHRQKPSSPIHRQEILTGSKIAMNVMNAINAMNAIVRFRDCAWVKILEP